MCKLDSLIKISCWVGSGKGGFGKFNLLIRQLLPTIKGCLCDFVSVCNRVLSIAIVVDYKQSYCRELSVARTLIEGIHKILKIK